MERETVGSGLKDRALGAAKEFAIGRLRRNQWRKGGLSVFDYLIRGHHRNSKFIFGGSVAVSEIDSMASQLAQTPEELAKLKTDVVMAQIALLHIEYGNPRYAGVYTDLARQIQELKSAA